MILVESKAVPKGRTGSPKTKGLISGIVGIVILASAGLANAAQQPEGEHFKATPARLKRGEYLSENLLLCFRCHSEMDWKRPELPIPPEKKGAGGIVGARDVPIAARGVPVVAPNITPDPQTGAGLWTDEQFVRALREGIGHDGRRLSPEMPYRFFSRLTDEDLASIIVYVRSLPPIHKEPPRNIPPAAALIAKGNVQPVELPKQTAPPNKKDMIGLGKYLVEIAHCSDCHTPKDREGNPMQEMTFGGGQVLNGPWGRVAAANITPDASGISYYNEKIFIEATRTGRIGARELKPIMGWTFYRHLTDDDLKAIFAYLRTLQPVHHRVDNTESPTLCKICQQEHGLGDQN